MKMKYINGIITGESLRDLLVEHYVSQPQCNWRAIIQITKDFGKCPLNAIRIFDDNGASIEPIVELLRNHEIFILHIQKNDEFTHTITIMNHTTEN